MKPVDWGDVQHFLAVAESGSIGSAAKRLAVNHSTVLRRLGRLEAALGSRLFDRLPGGYALTGAGNQLAEQLDGLSAQVESAQRQSSGLERTIEGTVSIACAAALVAGWLMPLLAQFRRRHPAVRLQLMVDGAERARASADLVVVGGDDVVQMHPDAQRTARVQALHRFLSEALPPG